MSSSEGGLPEGVEEPQKRQHEALAADCSSAEVGKTKSVHKKQRVHKESSLRVDACRVHLARTKVAAAVFVGVDSLAVSETKTYLAMDSLNRGCQGESYVGLVAHAGQNQQCVRNSGNSAAWELH